MIIPRKLKHGFNATTDLFHKCGFSSLFIMNCRQLWNYFSDKFSILTIVGTVCRLIIQRPSTSQFSNISALHSFARFTFADNRVVVNYYFITDLHKLQ